ncbi:MAG: TrkH family potassium uptake protein [Oscillospiraceae bacterium]|nr:TrkH family potassium uptake protein [Oscillospiraceae bacterium]MBQ6850001.1 TrkH family potassium uptake protein [Oscillospiraceae bacterium]MBR6610564.1 TrkH family potassium uptake protein [Oscillospiraceae bacterium]
MNFRVISKYMGNILMLEGAFMLPAIIVALIYKEFSSIPALVISILLCLFIGYILSKVKQNNRGIYAKEAYVSVALGWIILSFFGCLPFVFSGYIPSLVDAFFETVSGFTTTGSSILTNVELLSKSMLYWRSFTHWLGGMGVLVFLMAIVPMSNTKGSGEGLALMRAESPGPSVGKMTPTLRETARLLYMIYMVITVAEMVLLVISGMPLYDSIVTSFATAGTGGFGIKADSIDGYNYLSQTIVAVFMMLFGVNFSLYYLILMRKVKDAFANEELKVYLSVVALSTLIIFFNVKGMYDNSGVALLDSYFSVSSIITTTGFATANFDIWPQLSRFILVALMICGASAGSTGGGVKVSRVIIMWKAIKREIIAVISPRKVKTITMDGKPVSEVVIKNTLTYFCVYWFIAIGSMFLLTIIDGFNTEVTVTSVMACLNNIGPGLDMIGPAGNYSMFSPVSKIILSLNMLIGRLEIWPMLLLFTPSIYKNTTKKI